MDPSSDIPRLAGTGRLAGLLTGLALPFRAIRLVLTTPRLLVLALVAGTVTAATLVGLFAWLWTAAEGWAAALVPPSDSTFASVAATTLRVVFFVLSYVASALTVPNLMLAPLMDPLSEATELRLGGFVAPPFSLRAMARGTGEALSHTLLRLSAMLVGLLLLAPLNLIPVAGSALWVALSSTWTMFWLAVEHLSTPSSRHLISFGAVVRALARRPALALGFGLALWLMLWLPILNFFLMPLAAVAGTLLFRAMTASGDLPSAG